MYGIVEGRGGGGQGRMKERNVGIRGVIGLKCNCTHPQHDIILERIIPVYFVKSFIIEKSIIAADTDLSLFKILLYG